MWVLGKSLRRRGWHARSASLAALAVASTTGWASAAMSRLLPPQQDSATPPAPSVQINTVHVSQANREAATSAAKLADWIDEQTWSSEPAWLRQPSIDLHPEDVPETRPEPIPLPPAVMAGPIFLTSILAGAVMKKKRRGPIRVW